MDPYDGLVHGPVVVGVPALVSQFSVTYPEDSVSAFRFRMLMMNRHIQHTTMDEILIDDIETTASIAAVFLFVRLHFVFAKCDFIGSIPVVPCLTELNLRDIGDRRRCYPQNSVKMLCTKMDPQNHLNTFGISKTPIRHRRVVAFSGG